MGDVEDSIDSTEAEGGKGTEAVHNENKKAGKSKVSDADAEEGKQSEVTEVVDNESKADKSRVADAEDKAETCDVEDSNDLTEAEGGKVTEAVHNESKKAEKSKLLDADAEEGKQSEVTEVVDNKSKVSDAENTETGDGEGADEVTDNSVSVKQLDRNVTDISNDSETSDLDIDQEEVNKLFQRNESTDW